MNTDARRKATAAFVEKRKALGYRKVTLWFTPEMIAKVEAVAVFLDRPKDSALEVMVMDWGQPEPRPAKPPPAVAKPAKAAKLADTSGAKVRVPGRTKTFTPHPKPGKAKR